MLNNLSRLAYLASEFRPEIPSRKLMRYCPQGPIITALATHGVSGAVVELDLSADQLQSLYEEGRHGGPGSDREFRIILAQIISSEIDLRRDELTLTEYFKLIGTLSDYTNTESDQLVENDEASLDKVPESTPLHKWQTGFEPFDLITGGFYKGITMIMGRPGHGKTTLMLSMMEALRITGEASSIWFYELEIPLELMLYRNSPSRQRVKFKSDDRMICGLSSLEAVIERAQENPDPNRIIFIDSPDVMAGGIGEGRRFALEDLYRSLIRLKKHCKHVFVASQARRNDRTLTLDSGAEAWAKAFYVDIIITVSRTGRGVGSWSRVRSSVVKNRFGPPDREIVFNYNYNNLEFEVDSVARAQVNVSPEDDDW
jgi:hypothetical protein